MTYWAESHDVDPRGWGYLPSCLGEHPGNTQNELNTWATLLALMPPQTPNLGQVEKKMDGWMDLYG